MFKKYSILFLFSGFSTLMAYNLVVTTKGLHSHKGVVQFSLYNKEGTIPDKKLNLYYKMKRVTIGKDGVAKVTFKNLPEGRYAVSVFHDENDNGTIDKGYFMPEEGVGLSNFESINFLNLPDFKSASFELHKDMVKQIKMIYL